MTSRRLKQITAWLISLIGFSLLIYMVTVEGELGALPLCMILIGIIWTLLIFTKNHKSKQS